MMKNLVSMKNSILRILNAKSEEKQMTFIYKGNIEFFEELLGKKVVSKYFFIKMEDITDEDVTILQEYLDYINMIGD